MKSIEDIVNEGKAQRREREALARKKNQDADQLLLLRSKLMTSPFGRVLLKINLVGARLVIIWVLVLESIGFYFLDKYHLVKQYVDFLHGLPQLKGYNAESIVILVLMITPLIILALCYGLLYMIAVLTMDRYYLLEKSWLESLPFHVEGYWKEVGGDSTSLKVSVVYKNILPEQENLKDIAVGLGFDHERETEILASYYELSGEKLAAAIDHPETWNVTTDVFYLHDIFGKPTLESYKAKRPDILNVTKKLRHLITRCLEPTHDKFPIASVRVNH